MWVTPAVVAGLLGWPGIWGGGSAFGDLILPAPITGGIVHVPTFVLAILVARVYSKLPATAASLVRAGLVGAALVGLAHLVDLDRISLSIATDLPMRGIPWQQSYFGLCLLTDALWSIAWTIRRPRLKTCAVASVAILIALPTAFVVAGLRTSDGARERFIRGDYRDGDQRGDASWFIYTELGVAEPSFQAEARAAAGRLLTLPEDNAVVEDMAVYFTESLEAARRSDLDRVLLTLCVYEDGTSDRWLERRGDCFSDHVTFGEQLDAAFEAQPSGLPNAVRGYLAARSVCADVVLSEQRDQRLLARYRCYDLDSDLAGLEEKYENSPIAELLAVNRRSGAPAGSSAPGPR